MSPWRRILFSLASLALGLAVAEGFAWVGLWLTDESKATAPPAPEETPPAGTRAPAGPAAAPPATTPDAQPPTRLEGASAAQSERNRYWVVHPYVGYVSYPRAPVTVGGEVPGLVVNSFGFVDTQEPIRQRSPDKVIVALTGGSVAESFGYQGYRALERALSRDPAFAGKQFEWVRLALSGYKQPQQLMTISYLLTEGAHFDVVVNIDGFNEIALPRLDNERVGVSASFPRRWAQRIEMLPDPVQRRLAGQVEYLEAERQRLSRPPTGILYYSALARIWQRLESDRLDREVTARMLDLSRAIEGSADPILVGPRRRFVNRRTFAEHLVRIWERSSLSLAALGREHGFRFVHVLQPNQHVVGSKPLTAQEQILASDEAMTYRDDARDFHALLQEAGQSLRERGVEFIDATQVFEDRTEELYIDNCCHFNARGNEILAKYIAETMRTLPSVGRPLERGAAPTAGMSATDDPDKSSTPRPARENGEDH